MSEKVYITRKIPEAGIEMLRNKGYEVDVSEKDGILSKEELTEALGQKEYDAVLCLLTDQVDTEVLSAAPKARVFANYAVGYNNIDVDAANEKGVVITNTPGVLTESVATHAIALVLAVTRRVVEADAFTRAGKYDGWAPELFLGTALHGKVMGIAGAGRIGSQVAKYAKALGMEIAYYDVSQNEEIEQAVGATFYENIDELLENSDVVSVHVPLLDSTRHLINEERLAKMKKGAYLINTSRGPVIDEAALVKALQEETIRGAALDVFEDEPELAPGLAGLSNVVITPHIASATFETRSKMAEMAAENIIAVLEGEEPGNRVSQ